MPVTIRPERADDPDEVAAIAALNAAAFADPRYADLPAALRAAGHYRPDWCFVAVDDGVVVGHVMVGTTFLESEDGRTEVPTLSPLAVAPDRQRHGIGRALIETAAARLDADGEPFVVLEGSPDYYRRSGFQDSREHGVVFPLPDWAPPGAGQLRPLSGYRRIAGAVVYPPAVQAAYDAVG